MAYTPSLGRPPHNDAPGNVRAQRDDTQPGNFPDFGEDAPAPETPRKMAGDLTETTALKLAQDAYTTSTTYIDSNFRKQWETDLRYFDGRHASDSKYYKDAYKHRAKTFRPKSRSISRRMEALVASAFFSNDQKLRVDPFNHDDPMAVATAKMIGNLVDYRLKNTIPWFLTVVGGMQDAVKTGVVCSYNYWCYKSVKRMVKQQVPYIDAATGQPAFDMMTGAPLTFEQEVEKDVVVEDKPDICLFPVEYVRISPNSNWRDPINSSPYVGRMVPMYLSEVRHRMTNPDRYGRTWKPYTDGEIKSNGQLEVADSTRQTRLGNRQDPVDSHTEVSDYEIVWAVEWFIDRPSGRVVYWTLGTQKLLTDPEPIEDVYLHGIIPITMGYCVVETHKVMPKGLIGIGGAIQRALNNNANAREDNVALVLNKQYVIRSGQQFDTTNLMHGVPGGITAAQNPKEDVVPLEWNDVTSSAYQEQDRFNVEYDELVGNFSSQSVMTNRALNQTVGGLEILGEGAATLSEFTVRTLTESWITPTLNQLALLEQYYESDEIIMTLAGKQVQQAYRPSMKNPTPPPVPGLGDMVDSLIDAKCFVRIEVGMNATDPNRRLSRLTYAVTQVAQASSQLPLSFNISEYGKEIFNILGYSDGERFWDADEQAKLLLMKAQEQANQMVSEAQKVTDEIIKVAEERRKAAERAEEAAMEEQQQLLREINKLLERGIAVAMREIKVENDARFAKMEVKLAAAQAKAAMNVGGEAKRPNGEKKSKEKKDKMVVPNISVTIEGKKGAPKKTKVTGPDGQVFMMESEG